MTDTPAAETPSTETPPAAESTPPPASSNAETGPAGSATPDFSDIAAVLKAKPALSPEDALEAIAEGKAGTPTAETIIGIIQTALVLIGDDEGILTETEKMILRGPLDRVLKKYKVGDDVLPPEVDLAFALAGLVIVRLKKPKTATFAAKVKAWAVGMWFSQKGRTLAAKIEREVS